MLYKTDESAPLSGSQGGVVFAPIAGRGVARAGPDRVDPKTPAQIAARNRFVRAMGAWSDLLTAAQRTEWADDSGDATVKDWSFIEYPAGGRELFAMAWIIPLGAEQAPQADAVDADKPADPRIDGVHLDPNFDLTITWSTHFTSSHAAITWRIEAPDPRPGRSARLPIVVFAHDLVVPDTAPKTHVTTATPPVPLDFGDTIRLGGALVHADNRQGDTDFDEWPL